MRLPIVPLSFGVFIAACGGVENDPTNPLAENAENILSGPDMPAEEELNPIATLSLDNGNILDFYQPTPGSVLISEVGMAPNPLITATHDGRPPSLVEIYRTAAPGHPVPAPLIDVQRRLDARGALENMTVAEADVEPLTNHDDVSMNDDANQDDAANPDNGPCTARSFKRDICGSRSGRICELNRTSPRTARYTQARWVEAAVCLARGPVGWVSITVDGNRKKVSRQLRRAGTYKRLRWAQFPPDPPTFNARINGSARGGVFHFYSEGWQ